jgi:hypothetical protein
LHQAIQSAWNHDIVVLASSADEGLRETKDDFEDVSDHIFRITACDRWGRLLDRSSEPKNSYRFVGHNVQVGQVPFLKSLDSISGSSAATAIAAGVVSLIIAFSRLSIYCHSEHDDEKNNKWRTQMAKTRLEAMREGESTKFVVLDNICGKLPRGETLKDADFMTKVNSSFELRWRR